MPKTYNIFGVIFCSVMILIFGYSILSKIYFSLISKSWEPTQAEVINIDNSNPKSAELIYKYQYKDKNHIGKNLAYLTEGSIPDKHYINDNFKKNQIITIYLNTKKPEQSVVLKRPILLKYVWVYFFIIGFCSFLVFRAVKEIKKSNKTLKHGTPPVGGAP